MLKGAQKRMIVVKTTESKIFEEAYFVMRREYTGMEGDMVAEANRIIEGYEEKRDKKRRRGLKEWAIATALFLGGSALGGTVMAIVAFLPA